MTDFKRLYITRFKPGSLPLVFSIFALPCRHNDATFGAFSPPDLTLAGLHLHGRFPSPFQLPFPCSFSSPYSCCLQKFSIGATAFSSPRRFANHLLSNWGCHMMPSFSSSRTSFLLCFLHFRHRAYKCSTVCSVAPHHQHSGV